MSEKIIPKDEYGRPTIYRVLTINKGTITYDGNDPDEKGYIIREYSYDLDPRVSREEVLRHLQGIIQCDSMVRPDEKICEYEWMELCRDAYDKFLPWNSR